MCPVAEADVTVGNKYECSLKRANKTRLQHIGRTS